MKIRNKRTGEIREISENELSQYGITTPKMKNGGKKNWIPKNLKKGRCTPLGKPGCPPGSPQYNLAKTFKKHHGFHEDGGMQQFSGVLPYAGYQEYYGVMPYSRPQMSHGGAFISIVDDVENIFPYSRPQLNYGGGVCNVFPYSRPQLGYGGNTFPYVRPQMQDGGLEDEPMVTEDNDGLNHNLDFQIDINDNSDDTIAKSLQKYYKNKNRKKVNPGFAYYDVANATTGNYIQQSAMGLSSLMDAQTPAQAVVGAYTTIKNLPKGILEEMGNFKTEEFARKYENNLLFNQAHGILPQSYTNYSPERIHGDMAHPLQNKYGGKIKKYQEGGDLVSSIVPRGYIPNDINDFKSGIGNAEVEGGGTGVDGEILNVNGLIGAVSGPTHDNGGVPVEVPQGTKVLSDHLKFKFKTKPTTYAQEGKKYSTEKFADVLKNKYSDNLSRKSAELATKLNNEKFQELYDFQEKNKLSGIHGRTVQNKAITDMIEQQNSARAGGFIPKYQGGGEKVDNNPSLRGTGKDVENNFTDLNDVYANYVSHGYKGPVDITSMRRWAKTKNAQEVDAYIARTRPTNKHRAIWEKEYSTTEPIDLLKMTPQERFEGYDDQLWDFRASKFSTPTTSITTKTDTPADIVGTTTFDNITPQKQTRRGVAGIPIPFIHGYGLEPIHTKKLDPKHINYRSPDIENAINEANRQVGAIQRVLPVGSQGVANINTAFANAWRNKQGIYADDFNRRQQGMMAVDQFNVGQDAATEAINLQEFQQFRDLQQRRAGAVSTQQLKDEKAALNNYYANNQFNQSSDYINRTFNPAGYYNQEYIPSSTSLGTLDPTKTTQEQDTRTYYDENGRPYRRTRVTSDNKKYGGKVKSILKKRKK